MEKLIFLVLPLAGLIFVDVDDACDLLITYGFDLLLFWEEYAHLTLEHNVESFKFVMRAVNALTC